MLSSFELKRVEAYQNAMGGTALRCVSPLSNNVMIEPFASPLSFSEINDIAHKQVANVLRFAHLSRHGMVKAVGIVDQFQRQEAVNALLLMQFKKP